MNLNFTKQMVGYFANVGAACIGGVGAGRWSKHWHKKIHVRRKIVSLSWWDLPNHGASCRTLVTSVGKSSMGKGCIELVSWCFNLWWRSYWVLNKIFTKKSFKSKLKIVKEFGCALSIFQKPSMSRIQWKLKFGNFKT